MKKKKISGRVVKAPKQKAVNRATVKVYVNNKKVAEVKTNKKGKFSVKLNKKLKNGDVVKVTATKAKIKKAKVKKKIKWVLAAA